MAETSTRKINARLEREGWTKIGGGNHDKFANLAYPHVLIIVPRHKTVSSGVARDIARKAKWVQ